MSDFQCHNCQRPIDTKDLAFADCPARCEGGDLPYHYRCVMEKRLAARQHTPDPRVIRGDRRFMKWAERVTR